MNLPERLKRIVTESLDLNRSILTDLVRDYSGLKGHEQDLIRAQTDLAEIAQVLTLLDQ